MSDESEPKRSGPEAAERARAAADLEDILKLNNSSAFVRYFLRRLNEEAEKAKDKILDPGTPDDALHDLKVTHRTYGDILKLMQSDEAGCRSILARTPDPDGEEEPD